MDTTTCTILAAAANILRDEGLRRAAEARTLDERHCANSALQASVTTEQFLKQADDLERPF